MLNWGDRANSLHKLLTHNHHVKPFEFHVSKWRWGCATSDQTPPRQHRNDWIYKMWSSTLVISTSRPINSCLHMINWALMEGSSALVMRFWQVSSPNRPCLKDSSCGELQDRRGPASNHADHSPSPIWRLSDEFPDKWLDVFWPSLCSSHWLPLNPSGPTAKRCAVTATLSLYSYPSRTSLIHIFNTFYSGHSLLLSAAISLFAVDTRHIFKLLVITCISQLFPLPLPGIF